MNHIPSYPIPNLEDQSYVLLTLALGTAKTMLPSLNYVMCLDEKSETSMIQLGVKLIEGNTTTEQYIKEFQAILKKISKDAILDDNAIRAICGRIGLSMSPVTKNKGLEKKTDSEIKKDGTSKTTISNDKDLDGKKNVIKESRSKEEIIRLWWTDLHPFDKIDLGRKYFPDRHYADINFKDVMEIFKQEVPESPLNQTASIEEDLNNVSFSTTMTAKLIYDQKEDEWYISLFPQNQNISIGNADEHLIPTNLRHNLNLDSLL